MTGQIPPGQRLREAEWTQTLQVNRSALREAFARLEAQGAIQTGEKAGYFVPQLNKRVTQEILAVRVILESSAIEILCESGLNSAKRVQPVIDSLSVLESLDPNEDMIKVVEADSRFHQSLIEACGNKRLAAVYEHSPLPFILPNFSTGPEWELSVRRTIREHRAILDSILKGDAETAISLLRSHLSERLLQFAESLP